MNKLALIIALASISSIACAGDEHPFSLTTGLDYSTGKYGTANSTEISYVPVTGKYETDKLTLKLTVPYIRITGYGNVVKDIGTVGTTTSTQKTTASGMGDIVASAGYNVYDGGSNGVLVDLTGKIKFGTADSTKGLGTGKNDFAAQVDVYKVIEKTTLFGTVGYRIFGKPAGLPLNNVFYGTLGVNQKLSEDTSTGLMLDLRQRAISTGYPQRELTGYVTHKLSTHWKGQAYLVKGFADGSPDWGGGAMVSYVF